MSPRPLPQTHLPPTHSPGPRRVEALAAVACALLAHAGVLGAWTALPQAAGLTQPAQAVPDPGRPAGGPVPGARALDVRALDVRSLPGGLTARPAPASPPPAGTVVATAPAAPAVHQTPVAPARPARFAASSTSGTSGTSGASAPLAAPAAPSAAVALAALPGAMTAGVEPPVAAAARAGASTGGGVGVIAAATAAPAGPGAAGTASASGADDEHPPPPVYATRPPPPFRLAYALRRGALSGQAELGLQRVAGGYELDLRGTVLGLEVLGMSSRGGFGPQGFMPERFVDRRRGKDRLAANFDHTAGRITYSGTAAAQPLLAGAQDRLSWMVQLAAILEAGPARYPAGSRIALSVSGARGDVDTWTFIVQGRQRVDLPAGTVAMAVHLTREPRRPYDTQVEAWLDPARHHLPVRARLTVLPGGETLELSLAAP